MVLVLYGVITLIASIPNLYIVYNVIGSVSNIILNSNLDAHNDLLSIQNLQIVLFFAKSVLFEMYIKYNTHHFEYVTRECRAKSITAEPQHKGLLSTWEIYFVCVFFQSDKST